MKTRRKYVCPRGRLVLIITEDCLCSTSGDPLEFGSDPKVLIKDWDEESTGYLGQDL